MQSKRSFKLILVNGGWGISYKNARRWMPLDLIDDKSTLVQVMAWCRQATSHYLSQCWPRSMSPNGITRAANLWNIISVFCWKNFRILSNFSVSLNLFLTRLKTFIRQLPIYSGGTHPLPVETLVDSFGTTGTGSEARKRVTTTCGREKIECFGD